MSEQQEQFINVLNIVDNDDGSSTMEIEMDDKTQSILFREGLRLSIPDDLKGKVMVVEPDFYQSSEKVKTVEMPEEEINYFVEVAVVNALKEFIKFNKENV